MKKKNLSITSLMLILLLPLITLIGLATWFITTSVDSTPTYSFEDVVNYYLNNKEMEYNGQQAILDKYLVDCTIKYKTYGTEDDEVTGSPINAGVYTIIVTDTETNKSVQVKYTINPKPIGNAEITLEQDTFVDLGTGDIEPKVTNVQVDNLQLTESDYDISYKNNSGVGTGSVILTGKGNFTGTAQKDFTITAEEQDIIIELSNNYSQEYDKEPFEFSDIKVLSGNQELTDYNIEYAYRLTTSQTFTTGQPVNAGAYAVEVTISKNGYKTAKEVRTVIITQREITLNWTNTESVVYDGLPHKPNVEALNVISGDDVTLVLNFGDNLINATTYPLSVSSIEGTDKDNYKLPSNTSYSYTINPRPIKLKTEVYEMNYDSSKRTWTLIQAELKSKANFIDDEGKTWVPSSYIASGMYDGSFVYGTSSKVTNYLKSDGTNVQDDTMVGIDSSYAYVVGSTYLVTFEVTDTNYTLKSNGNTNLFKYKTAKIGSTYYTIEDAISASGNISFLGDSSGTATFLYTAFCNLTDEEGYPYSRVQNLNGKRLVVSCQETENTSQKYSQSVKSGNVYSALYIPNTVTLNLNSNAELMADATIGFSQPNTTISCNRGVVFNNGTINVKSGCTLNAYGYVKGNGLIEMSSGSNTVDCMHTYDWPGGNAARSMYSNVLPTNAWSAHNISCKSKINAGAIYGAMIYVYMDLKLDVVDAAPIATLIGSSSSSNCLFKGKSGYVMKSAKPAKSWAKNSTQYKELYLINGTNQRAGQRDDVQIFGEYEDSSLKISIKFSVISVAVETNTSKPATIGFMDLTIKNGATFSLTKSDYLFLPGSTFEIEKGGTVNVGANVDVTILTMNDFTGVTGNNVFTAYCVDKTDAKAIINGNMTINGSIGGNILTEEAGAILNISNGSITSSYRMFTSYSDPYYVSGTKTATGNIDGTDNSNLQTMSYISTSDGSICHWTAATNVKTFKIHFYDGSDLLETKEIQVVNGNTYTISGNEFIPSKDFYEFSEWKLSDGSVAIGNILTDGVNNNEINLYASWEETEYSFSYSSGYGTDENGDVNYVDATYQNIINTFKISDFVNGVLNIPTTATYQDKNFVGWYVGVDSSIGRTINSITTDQLKMFIEQYPGLPIPLYCEFVDEKVINVKYTSEIGTPSKTIDSITKGSSITLPDMDEATYNEYINNNQFNMYFVGWKISGQSDILNVGTIIPYEQLSDNTEFEAVWVNKVHVEIDYDGATVTGNMPTTGYYLPGTTITLTEPSKDNYEFVSWIVTNGDLNNNKVTITTDTSKEVVIKANLVILRTITIKNAYNGWRSFNATIKIYIKYNINDSESLLQEFSLSKNSSKNIIVRDGTYIRVNVSASGKSGNIDTSGNEASGDGYSQITQNTTYQFDDSSCLIAGTLITLADGSQKKVEDLNANDLLLVFNHETGKLDKAYAKFLIHKENEAVKERILYLTFSDGTEIGIVSEHGFFDKDKLEYVYINEFNVNDYIGHNFYTINNQNHSTTLISYRIVEEVTTIYSPISDYHMNCFANGLLTMSNFLDGFINIFKLDENMKYDEELMQKDLEMYGESTIEDFLVIADEDLIRSFPYKYVKVSIGKGKITYEEIEYLVKTFLTDDNRL